MAKNDPDQHLSQIETSWSDIFQAHQVNRSEDATMALHKVLLRYEGAIRRYLLTLTRNSDVADELAQDFAVRFLRGDFHRADPKRGRFRNLVKTAVYNLVIDYHRRQQSRPSPVPISAVEPVSSPETIEDLDRQFLECWRTDVLDHAWRELARQQDLGGAPYYTVLRFRADSPDLRSHEIAEQLSSRFGKPVTAGWVRQTLSVARGKYLDLVIAEVAHTLGRPTDEQLEDELRNLGLWDYCREAWLQRPGAKTSS